MAEQNNSKQTLNVVEVIGKVQENKLEQEEKKGKNIIKGSVVIKYGKKADQQVEVDVYQGEYNSDGKTESKKYPKLLKLMKEMTSSKEATTENPATVLRMNGDSPFCPQVNLNEYPSSGEVRSNIKIGLGFGNIAASTLQEKDFKAEFEMVVFLTKNPKKVKGKLIVEALYIDYQDAVKPLTFIVEDDELISNIEDCEKGQTVLFWGDLKVAEITSTKNQKSGFGGKSKTTTDVKTTRELIITGGQPIEEDDSRTIDSKFVKSALVARETFLEELVKEKASTKKKSGFGGAGNKTKTPDKPSGDAEDEKDGDDDDDLDIPF